MKYLFIFLTLFVSSPSFAEELTYRIDSKNYFWLFEEGSKWVLNTVQLKDNKLPKILDTKYLVSKELALSEIKQLGGSPLSVVDLKSIPHATTEVRNQSLWKVEHEWSWEWEKKYAEWVVANGDLNFLAAHNIATDCADVVMSYRWIFARIHKLPVAQNMGMDRGLFTQDSMKEEWLSIPTNENWKKDERFFKALDYMLSMTFTGTLHEDSYPIDLVREAFIPGFHYKGHGHSMISLGIVNNKSMQFISSTVPRQIRKLFFLDYFESQLLSEEMGGLLRFKWPYKSGNSWSLTSKEKMPFYGLSQYAPDLLNNEIQNAKVGIYRKLGMQVTMLDLYKASADSLLNQLWNRIFYVIDGFSVCFSTSECEPGSENYENYSTFSRDKRIYDLINMVLKLKAEYGSTDPEFEEYWKWLSEMNFFVTLEQPQLVLSFGEVVNNWLEKKYSSDPRDSIENRWGLIPEPSFQK